MTRKFEKNYRIREDDDVLLKENGIHQDIDLRLDAVEQIADDFKAGNRLDVDAIVKRIDADFAQKSAAIQELMDEADDGFTPERILETPEKRFTSDAEILDINTRISGKLNSATFTAHRDNVNNPHNVTAAQVGTLETPDILEALDTLEARILGNPDPSADTLEKLFALFAKRLRVDAAQTFTELEKSRARANMGASVLSGLRNGILNPYFDLWEDGTSGFTGGYNADQWTTNALGTTVLISQQTLAPGSIFPGYVKSYLRAVVTSVAGAGNFLLLSQPMEDVRRYAGKRCTVVFGARANAAKSVWAELNQVTGTGGTAMPIVPVGKLNLTTDFQIFAMAVDVPSVAGKTINDNDSYMALFLWMDAGSNFNARTQNLGQQSGTFDFTYFGFVEGDVTAEVLAGIDVTAPRHIQQETDLAQRYRWVVPLAIGYGSFNMGMGRSATTATIVGHYPTKMRQVPVLAYSALSDFALAGANVLGVVNALSLDGGGTSRKVFQISASIPSGLSAGYATFLCANNTANARLKFLAQL